MHRDENNSQNRIYTLLRFYQNVSLIFQISKQNDTEHSFWYIIIKAMDIN